MFGRRSTLWRWLNQRRVESAHSGKQREPRRVGKRSRGLFEYRMNC